MIKTFMRRIADLSPGCRQAVRLQSAALDGQLSPAQKVGLRIHLCLCKWCRRYGKQIEFLRTASRHESPADAGLPDHTLSPAARQRINHKLAEAQKEAGG